ncbi:MAG: hypothetical protein H6813_01465 [Phycisphaeraceae bacterium]|nr:hypothetical protein [Phycisphaeraceae bacterium]
MGRSLWTTARALHEGRTTCDVLDKAQAEIDADPVPDTHPALALTFDAALMTRTVGAVGRVAPWIEDPAIELADLAIREALFDATGSGEPDPAKGLRTIVASSKGAVLTIIDDQWKQHRDGAVALGPHEWLAHRLRRRLGLGHTTSVVAACATSACALHQARLEIESCEHDRVLVVGVEAALHPVFAHSYKRLGVLAPIDHLRAHRPRPLDENRAGFTLVEIAAAALLVREGLPDHRCRGALLGSAVGTQPHDIVRPAPVFCALASCIRRAVPRGTALTLIQPHATGTRDNDPRELDAIASALPVAHGAPVYASKGALGHPLGASALVNLALGGAAAAFRATPPMPWLENPIGSKFALSREPHAVEAGAQLLTSAGFGGHVGAVCFEMNRATT